MMNTATPFTLPPLAPVAPELLLVCVGLVLIGVDLSSLKQQSKILPWSAALGSLLALVLLYNSSGTTAFSGMYSLDGYSVFFKAVCLVGVIFTVLLSERYREVKGLRHGEYYSLLIFSAVGMMVMVSGADLVAIYLGLELMALSVYCLVGLLKKDQRASEAAIKYFLMGAFSSALLLYGLSLVYGMTGTTNLELLAQRIAAINLLDNPTLLVGLGLMLVSFCFKVAAAPFHMWTPDVYEGAPTPITAFMSVGPKAASFAVLGRVLVLGFPALHQEWASVVAVIALLTMAVGNLVALAQTSIKRMLAYSSIAHAGYALLGVLAGGQEGLSATMNYLLIYAFMNMGAFAVLILLADRQQRGEALDDYRGLAKTNPLVAALMLLFMFSLAGIPPTAGFIGKFYLLLAAIHAGYTGVVIGAVLLSAVSAFYYLRVVRYMYMMEPEESLQLVASPGQAAALALAVLGVIGLGLFPGSVVAWAGQALLGL